MSSYLLSQHAHVCVEANHLVMLDLLSGKYRGMTLDQASWLGAWVRGWPVPSARSRDQAPPAILARLLEAGVLTTDPAQGKPASPVKAVKPTAAIADHHPARVPVFRAVHLWQFLDAVLYAAVLLRCMKIRRIVDRLRRRKANAPHAASQVDLDRLHEAVIAFTRLRPFAYARTHNCLFHSLALMRFLTHYEIVPTLVFGVRTAPFRAHCWLQIGKYALTEAPCSVDTMTPIIVI